MSNTWVACLSNSPKFVNAVSAVTGQVSHMLAKRTSDHPNPQTRGRVRFRVLTLGLTTRNSSNNLLRV
jgi:hypothetical protein